MKKVTGVLLAMVVMGVMLTGCYNKSCENPRPHSYKGEAR